jgi:hypothetical protein
MDLAATVSNADGVDAARNPRHLMKTAKSDAITSRAKHVMINGFRNFMTISLVLQYPIQSSKTSFY